MESSRVTAAQEMQYTKAPIKLHRTTFYIVEWDFLMGYIKN